MAQHAREVVLRPAQAKHLHCDQEHASHGRAPCTAHGRHTEEVTVGEQGGSLQGKDAGQRHQSDDTHHAHASQREQRCSGHRQHPVEHRAAPPDAAGEGDQACDHDAVDTERGGHELLQPVRGTLACEQRDLPQRQPCPRQRQETGVRRQSGARHGRRERQHENHRNAAQAHMAERAHRAAIEPGGLEGLKHTAQVSTGPAGTSSPQIGASLRVTDAQGTLRGGRGRIRIRGASSP